MNGKSEFSTIVEMFDIVVDKFKNDGRPMLMRKVNGEYRDIAYTEIQTMVEDVANGLAELGVKQGDTIGLISENRPEWVVADLGLMKLGAVNVPLYPTFTPKQTEYIFNDAKVEYAIVSNQFQLNKVLKIIDAVPTLKSIIVFSNDVNSEDARVIPYLRIVEKGKSFRKEHPEYVVGQSQKIRPDDLLTIIYTSGTTGNPKGVMLTHNNLVSNIRASASCIPFNHEDTILSFLPLCHSYERMAGYYTAMFCGATIAYAESIDTVRDNLIEVHPTVVTTVPRLFERIYNRLMKQVGSSSSMSQKIFNWAIRVGKLYIAQKKSGNISLFSAVNYRLAKKLVFGKILERTGGRIRFFVSGGAALSKELAEFFEIVGIHIIEGYGMTESSPVISVNRVYDYKFGTVGKLIPGIEVKIAADGEILTRGPHVMKGYWNNPEATREILDNDGWLHTGDIGQFDPDGFLVITDRKKHIFVSSGGKNIAPQHIESVFLRSKFIDQFILIGDKRMFLTALIVPDFEALKEYARQNAISFSNDEELAGKPEVYDLLYKEIGQLQQDLANYERIRRFTILDKPLTVENGEITPTMKVRRSIIEEKFKQVIDKMYEGVN